MSRGKGKAAMEPQDYVPLLKGRPSTRDLEGRAPFSHLTSPHIAAKK